MFPFRYPHISRRTPQERDPTPTWAAFRAFETPDRLEEFSRVSTGGPLAADRSNQSAGKGCNTSAESATMQIPRNSQ